MPFALIIVGIWFLVAAVRGTQGKLFELITGDFTGEPNFSYWVVLLLAVGVVGYWKPARTLSTSFLVLIVLVVFLSKGKATAGGGFFEKLTAGLKATNTPAGSVSV